MIYAGYVARGQRGAGPDGVAYAADGVELRTLGPAWSDPDRVEAITNRIRLLRLVDHPGVRQVVASDWTADPPWMALELFDGQSPGPLPILDALNLTLEVAELLAAAHRVGLTHGRLKRSSVRIAVVRAAKVTDGAGAELAVPDVCGSSPPRIATRPRLDFSGTCILPEDGSIPSETKADDVAALGQLMTELSASALPLPLIALHNEWTAAVPDDRPTMAGVVVQLRRVLAMLQEGLSATAVTIPPSSIPGGEGRATASPSGHLLSPPEILGGGGGAVFSSLPPLAPPAGTREAATLSPEARKQSTPARLGRFTILEKLGEGGMGTVYKARDEADGRVVAIKTLLPVWASDPDALRRFRKEARLLAEVNNPYVANLLDVNEDAGVHFIAVEFVAGSNAASLLQTANLPDESFALAILSDVCRALTEAHQRGIVHRDIKPDNILLTGQTTGHVAKLADFGLARHAVESESLAVTRAGAILGTPLYMSPEQCRGEPLDVRSDVYSLGATLFHLIMGRPPFSGVGPMALIHHHCHTPPPPLIGASDGTARIVAKALAKAPAQRFADAAELLGELERVRRGEIAQTAHPALPACDPSRVITYEFCWELDATPEQLWPFVSNTERLNKAIGLPAVEWSIEPLTQGGTRRRGRFRKLGIEVKWTEHAYEWVEGRRLGVLRECSGGPLRWLLSEVELKPRSGKGDAGRAGFVNAPVTASGVCQHPGNGERGVSTSGTTLTHRLRTEPNGLLGRAFATLELGIKTRRALEGVYRRIDATVRAGRPEGDPFEDCGKLSRAQRRRLNEALTHLAERVPLRLADALGDYLATAAPQELARLRPIALARRLGLPKGAFIEACLHAARCGILTLLWDLICPLCRIPSEAVDSLRALQDHGHCEACNSDYELDFGRSVEAVFRVHPSIREAELGVYCIGGPSHSPHVVAQLRLAPQERLDLDLTLGEGAYRLRGPQLPVAVEARVLAEYHGGRWEVDLGRLRDARRARLRPGGQTLTVHNPFAYEVVIRVERTADRDDALTAAQAASLAAFRELFGDEVLSAGRLVSLNSITFLLTTLTGIHEKDDAKGFALIREHLTRLGEVARLHGGAVVKAVGDGGLLAFPEPTDAVHAALEILQGGLRLAVHRGPVMAATINDRLDYFGATTRELGDLLASGGVMVLSQSIMEVPGVSSLLRAHGRTATMELRGVLTVHKFN